MMEMDDTFKVGDRVVVQGKLLGTVKYFGSTDFKDGEWVGIELDKPRGKNNGSVQGKTYFTCAEDHGLFIQPLYIKHYKEEDVAALTLQSNFRAHLAKKKVKARQAVRTWNVLDNHYEEVGLRKGKAVEKATKELAKKTKVGSGKPVQQPSQDASQSSEQQQQQQQQQSSSSDEKVEKQSSGEVDTAMEEASSSSEEEYDDEEEDDMIMGATVDELQQAVSEAVEELQPEMLFSIKVANEYEGPHLSFPLRLENVLDMLDAFKQDKLLHFKYFMLLMLYGKKLFETEKTLQDIQIPAGVKLTVVGDTHGQLQDLYTIFTINGIPSDTNWYLFNGDFVDRGPRGVEIVASMLAFKILYPRSVFLNRGNHEARAQNAWMGFEEELLTKYGHDHVTVAMKPSKPPQSLQSPKKKARKGSVDRATNMRRSMNVFGPGDRLASLKLYMLCQALFDSLPLCALIQERVFVCHGGLFRNEGVKLDHIRSINRRREPPLEGKTMEDRIYEDLLWSDPRPSSTYPRPLKYKRPSERGAGCEFGPLVTNQFCATNQIALVVRSHECVPEGYEVLHNGRLITIFSASRYCGTQTNKGAFISFGPDLQPEIQQFYAHHIERGQFMTDEEREALLEREAVKMIIENICDKRLDLYWYFTQNDKSHSGRTTRVEWATGLANVLGLDLPFLHYQPHLAELEQDGSINYTKFLSRFQIQMRQEDSSWQDAIVQRICEKLYSLVGADLEQAYKKFDINDDGQVAYDEFMKTIKSLLNANSDEASLTDQQIYELMRSVDVDDDAHLDFREFANRFGVPFQQIATTKEQQKRFDLRNRTASMRALEEKSRLEMPEAPISPRSAQKMKLDFGTLDSWTVTNLNNICKAMYTKTDTLRKAFKAFDGKDQKFIELDDFVSALQNFCGLDISKEDATKLYKVIDTNNSGRINYLEFIDAFRADDRNPRAKSWQQGVVQQVANVLYQNRIHLKAAFRMFDVDGDGVITADEFQEGMKTINDMLDKPLTLQQIDELRRGLDKNGDGYIDYKEFFHNFSISDTAAAKGLTRRGSSYMDFNDPMFSDNAPSVPRLEGNDNNAMELETS